MCPGSVTNNISSSGSLPETFELVSGSFLSLLVAACKRLCPENFIVVYVESSFC